MSCIETAVVISDTQKKILTLLADGEFHSGAELAGALGLSRSAIWKQLNSLEGLGVHHSAVSGKGYRLAKRIELLDGNKINAQLGADAKAWISSLEIHDLIDSTNTYLSGLARQHAPSGFICLAERQTAGKGRRGRQWVSPYGNNIHLSILWRFQHGPAALSALSLAIGVAVIRALKAQGVDDIGLKWPNDVYSQGKKLGGILIEIAGENEGPCHAVIGLGLNLFLPEEEAGPIDQPWTDLSRIAGNRKISRNQLTASLINHLLTVIVGFEQHGFEAFRREWRAYDCLQGLPATVFAGSLRFDGQ
ncbi:MAG TPA: bifunctional biotin--[acetyl-CoA-carboxylase] ligase/biotin operon repressor BirA, partial [Methylomicrobium sp.]|nr:bifunctional biotin--[acetyl-CoA-carboxylase] ligase/biotin operon repressor BirA [Methylomicrobium sp.]